MRCRLKTSNQMRIYFDKYIDRGIACTHTCTIAILCGLDYAVKLVVMAGTIGMWYVVCSDKASERTSEREKRDFKMPIAQGR